MTHERRYVMDSPEGLDWWSVDSDLSVLVNATYVQRKVLSVSCTASVGSVYEKTTTLKYTARTPALALPPPPQPPHTFSVDVVSASMASSHHDGKDAYSAGEFFTFFSLFLVQVLVIIVDNRIYNNKS